MASQKSNFAVDAVFRPPFKGVGDYMRMPDGELAPDGDRRSRIGAPPHRRLNQPAAVSNIGLHAVVCRILHTRPPLNING